MSQPRLSIVIATRQAVAVLGRCLSSIVEQDFSDWEILVADAASLDGTVDVIREFGHSVSWWQSKEDAGIADAWNQAIARARGEYVTFFGADDALHTPSTLSKVFAYIGSGHYDLVTGRGNLISKGGKQFEFGGAWDFRKVARRMTICHPGCLHRRDLFRRFGPFDTSYRISADYDFLLRLPGTISTLHCDLPLVDVGDGGISRKKRWAMLQERYRAQAYCPRIGHMRAALNFMDKIWRIPVAKVLGIPC